MKNAVRALALLSCALIASAQDPGPTVTLSQGPPTRAYQVLTFPDGSNNTIYVCYARSAGIAPQTPARITVSGASNASPVSFTATAHGFDYRSLTTTTPAIKITGGTGNWTAINGVWKATVTSANAFTIAVDSTTFGTFSGQTLTVTTLAPQTTALVWAIKALVYDASNNLLFQGWASNPGGAGSTNLVAGTPNMNLACASRTSYSYQ